MYVSKCRKLEDENVTISQKHAELLPLDMIKSYQDCSCSLILFSRKLGILPLPAYISIIRGVQLHNYVFGSFIISFFNFGPYSKKITLYLP